MKEHRVSVLHHFRPSSYLIGTNNITVCANLKEYLREFLLEVIVVKISTATSKKDILGEEFSKNGL